MTKSMKAISFQLGEAAQHFGTLVEQIGEVVEVTAGPMSQLFWKVNEVKMFTGVVEGQYPLIGTKSRGFQLRCRKRSCFQDLFLTKFAIECNCVGEALNE